METVQRSYIDNIRESYNKSFRHDNQSNRPFVKGSYISLSSTSTPNLTSDSRLSRLTSNPQTTRPYDPPRSSHLPSPSPPPSVPSKSHKLLSGRSLSRVEVSVGGGEGENGGSSALSWSPKRSQGVQRLVLRLPKVRRGSMLLLLLVLIDSASTLRYLVQVPRSLQAPSSLSPQPPSFYSSIPQLPKPSAPPLSSSPAESSWLQHPNPRQPQDRSTSAHHSFTLPTRPARHSPNSIISPTCALATTPINPATFLAICPAPGYRSR